MKTSLQKIIIIMYALAIFGMMGAFVRNGHPGNHAAGNIGMQHRNR